jgi:iron-regulated transporter 1
MSTALDERVLEEELELLSAPLHELETETETETENGNGNRNSSVKSESLSRSQAWNLYTSHLLSTWNARTYEFAAVSLSSSLCL